MPMPGMTLGSQAGSLPTTKSLMPLELPNKFRRDVLEA